MYSVDQGSATFHYQKAQTNCNVSAGRSNLPLLQVCCESSQIYEVLIRLTANLSSQHITAEKRDYGSNVLNISESIKRQFIP